VKWHSCLFNSEGCTWSNFVPPSSQQNNGQGEYVQPEPGASSTRSARPPHPPQPGIWPAAWGTSPGSGPAPTTWLVRAGSPAAPQHALLYLHAPGLWSKKTKKEKEERHFLTFIKNSCTGTNHDVKALMFSWLKTSKQHEQFICRVLSLINCEGNLWLWTHTVG
jgi:hypothetical protein